MPIREFRCCCGHTFEHLLTRAAFDYTTDAICPKCDDIAVAKEISHTTAILKAGIGGFHKPSRGESSYE